MCLLRCRAEPKDLIMMSGCENDEWETDRKMNESTTSDSLKRVLVLNSGSSSLKFTLYNMCDESRVAHGIVERIGLDHARLRMTLENGTKFDKELDIKNHDQALRSVCEELVNSEHGALEALSDVQALGHRVVHGGESFSSSVLVTDEVKAAIDQCSSLAPLHNPPNLGGIEACERVFPGTPNVAVFDTAFHSSMPPSSYLYAIPIEYYEKYGVRKYGFHGTSHRFVAHATADFLDTPLDKLKLITCHLGNGASITAIANGKVLDTSMGMTPLPGLVMGTRCGDLDPAIVLYLVRMGMSADDVDKLLNKKSGLLGVTGLGTSDMRDIINAAESGNEKAVRALWMFVQRLVSYIGSYYTLLGGADAVVFTGGIGENSAYIRQRIICKLSAIGCRLDEAANSVMGKPALVSDSTSNLKAVVMPTNEELMIARETVNVLS